MRIASTAKSHLVVGVVVALLSLSLPGRVLALRAESDQLAELLGEDNAETAHQLTATVSSLFEYEKTMKW